MATATRGEHLEAARRLLAHEATGAGGIADHAAAAASVYAKLFRSLGPLLGEAGVGALLARSVKLTQSAFPALADVLAGGELPGDASEAGERLRSSLGRLEPTDRLAAAAAVYGAFLRLLTSFVGEALVRQVLRNAFSGMDQGAPKEDE